MIGFLGDLFSTEGFMPRWLCGEWSEAHGWLHIVSDTLVFGAYSAIPVALWYFVVLKKHQVPFSLLFWLFGAFILSCGFTHLIDATLFWKPWYRLSGLMKLVTALVSWATVLAMWRVFPKALSLPGIEELNRKLQAEVVQRRQAEAEREILLASERSSRQEAEHANRMKEEFVATLSHELRTPLNAILGYVSLMREEDGNNAELVKKIEVIERNALSQKRLVEDLLDTNRIITGKLRLDVQSVDLGGVIENALDSLRPQALAKTIRLAKVIEGAPVEVRGDPTRLQQIFWNLVSNAIKFTPAGGRVEVLLERVNSHVEVTVNDSGIGISSEDLARIFERFKQVDSTSARRYGGLGLGLAICKALVEMHGGSIVAKSSGPGQGASFRVALPLPALQGDKEQHDRRHPQAAAPASEPTQLPRLEGLSLLVVDDDADSRDLLKHALSQLGAGVRTVDSAAGALTAADAEEFDVILSDIGMPDMDGLGMITELRRRQTCRNQNVPAVALTAYAATEDRKRALLAGFDTFLSKPVDLGEVVAVVARMAQRKLRQGGDWNATSASPSGPSSS
jgi:signal transduction histidine kinase/CheY-like chemotaxis protein